MNSNSLADERNPVQQHAASDESPSAAAPASAEAGTKGLLVSTLVWTSLGTALYFILYAVSAGGLSPIGTFVSAFLSGAVGVLVCSFGLRGLRGYSVTLLIILLAYVMRVLVSVLLYVSIQDPNYFDGNGKYVNKNWEFQWTYTNVNLIADSVSKKGEWRPSRIIDPLVDKNLYIHAWMGYFLAAGGSRHALDLSPFNAFHHAVAGILIAATALACGYSLRVSLLSGWLVVWIPWGFAALMWRDSVGFFWVVLAVALLSVGRSLGTLGSLVMSIPAAFLAWADRSAYLLAIVAITALVILYDQQKLMRNNALKVPRMIAVSVLLAAVVFMMSHDVGQAAFERHQLHSTGTYLSSRIILVPLLILRALAGPFPWFFGGNFDLYNLCDYAFHLLQFAVFLIYAVHWRSILKRMNILHYAAAIFWVMAFIAGGVHTAYLAVAFPFVLPPILSTGTSVWKYAVISAACFVLGNVLWLSFGLGGSGLVLRTTGY
jgi:hypothetical protein